MVLEILHYSIFSLTLIFDYYLGLSAMGGGRASGGGGVGGWGNKQLITPTTGAKLKHGQPVSQLGS